jgi:hypothetical protein
VDGLTSDQLVNLRLAYQEVCKSHQSIADFRAKLLGFLPLASGAGLFAWLDADPGQPVSPYAWVMGIFGFLVTLGLFFYELRGIQRSQALERSGQALESALGLTHGQFLAQPEAYLGGLVSPRAAAWLIYPTVLTGWAYLAGVQRFGAFWAAVVALLVVVVVAFTVVRWFTALESRQRAEQLAPDPVGS